MSLLAGFMLSDVPITIIRKNKLQLQRDGISYEMYDNDLF